MSSQAMAKDTAVSIGADRPHELASIQQVLIREARLLDEGRFEAWLEMLTPDFEYWAPIRRDSPSPRDEVSLFYDNIDSLTFRIGRLRHPEIHVQMPPSRTARQVTNVEIEKADQASVHVRSNFSMFEYRPGWEKQWFAGYYEHELVGGSAGYRIRRKKAVLIDADGLMPPLALPF